MAGKVCPLRNADCRRDLCMFWDDSRGKSPCGFVSLVDYVAVIFKELSKKPKNEVKK